MARGAVALLLVLAGCQRDAPGPKHRPLTAGEIARVEPLFRDSIDYATVRVVDDHPDQGAFFHEIAHVWQRQNGIDVTACGPCTYTLAPDRDLLDYGTEQAACILEDYFLIRNHALPPRHLQDPVSEKHRDALYSTVLERFLADPKYVRSDER
jgi:hypothetical protein